MRYYVYSLYYTRSIEKVIATYTWFHSRRYPMLHATNDFQKIVMNISSSRFGNLFFSLLLCFELYCKTHWVFFNLLKIKKKHNNFLQSAIKSIIHPHTEPNGYGSEFLNSHQTLKQSENRTKTLTQANIEFNPYEQILFPDNNMHISTVLTIESQQKSKIKNEKIFIIMK